MRTSLFNVVRNIIATAAIAGMVISCQHKSPCPSISYEKYKECACHPDVRFAIDIMAGANLNENVQTSIEKCITGDTDTNVEIRGKNIAKIKADLKGCVSRTVQVNAEVMNVIEDIATAASSRAKPPTEKDICYWNKCIYGGDNSICEKLEGAGKPADAVPPSAFGLTFKKIVWRNYYLANADFKGEIDYSVVNNSTTSIVMLPPFQAAWFGRLTKRPTITTKIYGEDKNLYTIEQGHISDKEESRTDLNGQNKLVTSYLWQFNIKPSLDPQRSLHYALIIETKGTEKEAFTPEGSFAGMWSPYPVAELACELYAPAGFKFKKEPHLIRDRTGKMQDLAAVSKPEYSDDEKKISWTVAQPTPNLEYLIKVVIVKAN